MEKEKKEIIYKKTANYYETDQMAIIHHSNYIRWFEEARMYFLKETGLSYDRMEEMGIFIPVLHVSCQYKSPVHFAQTVEIHVKVKKFNGIKMTIAYDIYDKATQERKTVGESGHCFTDRDFKPFSMKKKFPEIYKMLCGFVEE